MYLLLVLLLQSYISLISVKMHVMITESNCVAKHVSVHHMSSTFEIYCNYCVRLNLIVSNRKGLWPAFSDISL